HHLKRAKHVHRSMRAFNPPDCRIHHGGCLRLCRSSRRSPLQNRRRRTLLRECKPASTKHRHHRKPRQSLHPHPFAENPFVLLILCSTINQPNHPLTIAPTPSHNLSTLPHLASSLS